MLCKIIAKIPRILKDKAQSISSSLNQREGEKINHVGKSLLWRAVPAYMSIKFHLLEVLNFFIIEFLF